MTDDLDDLPDDFPLPGEPVLTDNPDKDLPGTPTEPTESTTDEAPDEALEEKP